MTNETIKLSRCPICHGKSNFEEYSEGVYVAGCCKKFCYSLPFCGASSKEEAASAWNAWVTAMLILYPVDPKKKTVIITCRKCGKPAKFSRNEEVCDSCGHVFNLYDLEESEQNGKI